MAMTARCERVPISGDDAVCGRNLVNAESKPRKEDDVQADPTAISGKA